MKDENKVHGDAALVNLQGAGSVVRRRCARACAKNDTPHVWARSSVSLSLGDGVTSRGALSGTEERINHQKPSGMASCAVWCVCV